MVATKGRSGREQEQQLASDGRVEAEPSGQAVRPAAAQELVHRLEVQAEGAAVGQEAVPDWCTPVFTCDHNCQHQTYFGYKKSSK